MNRRTLLLLASGLLVLSGCKHTNALQPGLWRAWLDCQGHELAFGLEIARTEAGYTAWVLNGDERLSVPRVVQEGTDLVFDIEDFDAGLRGTPSAGGARLDGHWWRRIGPSNWAKLPFHAEFALAPGERTVNGAARSPSRSLIPRSENSELARRFAGRWSVHFADHPDSSVGVFRLLADGTMRGTFLNPTGDYRTLAGNVQGGRLRLSRFDGAHAFHFEASLSNGDTIQGGFWEGDYAHLEWTGWRDAGARTRDPFRQLEWSGALDLRHLSFPDPDGRVFSLAEPPCGGKAIVVEIFGTWCPNCHDSGACLMELYQRYRGEGLSVVGLAFELTPDFERNASQVRKYKEHFGIEYPLLLASRDSMRAPSEVFPTIHGDYAVPTILFLHGDGSVRAVHSGFTGPATGEAYVQLRARFEDIVRELLDEPRSESVARPRSG